MSFFSKISVEKVIGNLLRRNVYDYPAFQVVEVKPEDYVHYQTIAREDSLVFYGNQETNQYEIVLFKELQSKTAFSIIRCKEQLDAFKYFHGLSDKLPQLLMICPNSMTTDAIQEISNYVRDRPNQSLAHVSAYFGYNDYFKQLSSSDVDIINNRCPDTGLTPLHIAVKSGRLATVQALIGLLPKIDLFDNENNNALHFAASTNKDIINILCTYAQTNNNGIKLIILINWKNKDNFSPLYLACLNDKPDCVKELLKNGADANGASIADESRKELLCEFDNNKTVIDHLDTKDMKNGGSPLHWSRSPAIIEALIEMGCDIDARNFQGETVLHLMVTRNKLACIITLLSYGADVNAKGPNGNTPLHLAVKGGDVAVVQAIVVFGADVNLQNSSGESARHLAASAKRTSQQDLILYVLHSVGAKRCSTNRINCNDGCSQSTGSHFNGIPSENSPFKRSEKFYDELLGEAIVKKALTQIKSPNDPLVTLSDSMEVDSNEKSRCKVLSLDGGGIRGLILVQMLWVLEVMMQKKVTECFDWISGTSTGGILALSLAMGHSAHECRQLYFKLKDKVFVGVRPYDSEPLEKFLQKALGDDCRMSDVIKPKIMITATVADRFPPALQLFRNYESPNEILGHKAKNEPITEMPKRHEQFVWKTARSSGAAPTYFRPCGCFLDGGLIANNPTLDTLTEIHTINKALDVMNRESDKLSLGLVVSLGTGAIPIKQVPVIDVYKPDSLFGVAKIAVSASALGQLLIEQATQSDGQVVERAKAWCSMIDLPFFRLNPPLSEDIPLDETNNIKLVNMLWETTAYMHSRKSEVQELIQLLLN